jgi:hypothetical protein
MDSKRIIFRTHKLYATESMHHGRKYSYSDVQNDEVVKCYCLQAFPCIKGSSTRACRSCNTVLVQINYFVVQGCDYRNFLHTAIP